MKTINRRFDLQQFFISANSSQEKNDFDFDKFTDEYIERNPEKELTELDIDIIKAISHNMPYTQSEVKRVYLHNKSFDKTIYCLRKSIKLAVLPEDLDFGLF